jgi:hypothetical protein
MMMRRPVATIVAALVIAGCGTSVAPDPVVPESALHFLVPDSGAPGFLGDTVRFYAVAGKDRSVVIYYQDRRLHASHRRFPTVRSHLRPPCAPDPVVRAREE